MSDWNNGIIERFRSNGGNVGPPFEGAPLIILHTTGAKTGKQRLAPLMSLPRDGRLFVVASKAGADSNPDWLHNLRANPTVTVETADETYQATAVELAEPERTEVYAAQAAARPAFADYLTKTSRVIPVIELIRV